MEPHQWWRCPAAPQGKQCGLLPTLLFTSSVVTTVFLEVSLFTALVDLCGQNWTVFLQSRQLSVEAVVRFLGKPSGLVISHVLCLPKARGLSTYTLAVIL